MKKMLLLAVAALMAFSAFGADTDAKSTWSPFQLVFLPGFPKSSENTELRGLKLGIPCTGGNATIRGIEASFLYSGSTFHSTCGAEVLGIQGSWFGPSLSDDLTGIQGSMSFAMAKKMTGFQAAGIAFITDNGKGCQAALGGVAQKDFAGFQTGAANVTVGSFTGMQFGAVNVASSDMNGMQVGAVAVAEEAHGCQINLVNIASKIADAFQCGIFNYSASKGFQLGAVNIIADSWLPVMIIVNFSL